MQRLSTFVVGLALTGVMAVPVFAHHPFDADYDAKKPVTLSGTITQIEWMSPHVHTFLDVRDEKGAMAKWDVEMGSPADLGKTGLTRMMLKEGDSVTIEGWKAKDGTLRANAKSVKLPNARVLSAASSYNGREAVATSGKN